MSFASGLYPGVVTHARVKPRRHRLRYRIFMLLIDLDEAREALADRHLGAYASLADYVQEVTEETTEIPQSLRYYVDYQAMARDAELNGDLFTVSTAWDVVHVFAGC